MTTMQAQRGHQSTQCIHVCPASQGW